MLRAPHFIGIVIVFWGGSGAMADQAKPVPVTPPLRVGIIASVDPTFEKMGPTEAWAREAEDLPDELLGTDADGKAFRREVVTGYVNIQSGTDDDKPAALRWDVLVLPPMWATHLGSAVDQHAARVHRYIKLGGGLVVYQPNPAKVYDYKGEISAPPRPAQPGPRAGTSGAPLPPKEYDPDKHLPDAFRVKLLPHDVVFRNSYVAHEAVRIADPNHPITRGLKPVHMPFPADRMVRMDKAWTRLAEGKTSEAASLAVATFGKGRVVLISDNIAGGSYSARPLTVNARSLLWASGAADARVASIDDRDVLVPKTIQAGQLDLETKLASDRPIEPFQRVRVRMRWGNKSHRTLDVPRRDATVLGVEIRPADAQETWTFKPLQSYTKLPLGVVKAGTSQDWVDVDFWFTRNLMPADGGHMRMGPGKYRFRLSIPELDLTTDWMKLTVRAVQASESVAALRKEVTGRGGRFFLADATRDPPDKQKDGSVRFPLGPNLSTDIGRLRLRAGDTIYLAPGSYDGTRLMVPEGVTIRGAGAGLTVIRLPGPGQIGAKSAWSTGVVLADGACLKDLTVYVAAAGSNRGSGVSSAGKGVEASLERCYVLDASTGVFATVHATKGAKIQLRRCVVVGPVNDYALFARDDAEISLERCTVFSRGFGLGLMGRSTATIEGSIIAGARPAIATDTQSFSIARSLVYCPSRAAQDYKHRVLFTAKKPYGDLDAVLDDKTIVQADPQFKLGTRLGEWLVPKTGTAGSKFGAHSGNQDDWPGPFVRSRDKLKGQPEPVGLPDVSPYLKEGKVTSKEWQGFRGQSGTVPVPEPVQLRPPGGRDRPANRQGP